MNLERKKYKRLFRSAIRRESASRLALEKETIINSRHRDPKLIHKLVKQQRSQPNQFIEDLYVGNTCFSNSEIIEGFKTHLKDLANPSANPKFNDCMDKIVTEEVKHIDMTQTVNVRTVSRTELESAINSINRGKAADIYKLSIESIIYASDKFKDDRLIVINEIFQSRMLPESLKIGLMSPIFKNKGTNSNSANYRGITVLPVLEKIVASILKKRIVETLESDQSPFQRGFTKSTSPLHAAIVIEEIARDSVNKPKCCKFVLLDAKLAFDVVSHSHLIRRLYHSGIEDKHLNLIHSLRENSSSSVKWGNRVSEPFKVFQGVKQGGVVSTDFYKTYINPLLKSYENNPLGCYIGNIHCSAIACADDVAICSHDFEETQQLIMVAEDYANQERYTLQPSKTENVHFKPNIRNSKSTNQFELYGNEVPNVRQSTHLGIIRATTLKETREVNVESSKNCL